MILMEQEIMMVEERKKRAKKLIRQYQQSHSPANWEETWTISKSAIHFKEEAKFSRKQNIDDKVHAWYILPMWME